MNEQVREPGWAPETDESNGRNRRAWSIEDLRSRLGVAAPDPRQEKQDVGGGADMTIARPRIVRRGMVPALA